MALNQYDMETVIKATGFFFKYKRNLSYFTQLLAQVNIKILEVIFDLCKH